MATQNILQDQQGLAEFLTKQVIAFCHELRKAEVPITTGDLLDALRGLSNIDVLLRNDFYYTLLTTLVKSAEHRQTFEVIFNRFWHSFERHTEVKNLQNDALRPGVENNHGLSESRPHGNESGEPLEVSPDGEGAGKVAYSPLEILAQKNFSTLKPDELEQIESLIKLVTRRLTTRFSRRKVISRRGPIDARRTPRLNMQFGGEILRLARKSRRKQKLKLVVVCDVSGSMKSYSQFAIQCIFALQNALGKIETFLFSTRLTRVTEHLKRNGFADALNCISCATLDWGGGTKIGESLMTLNREYGHLLDHKTIVIILSDGWDTGDIDLLQEQMREIKSRARRTLWLNPLLEDKGYEPICRGMKSALPYIDLFTHANSVRGLENFVKTVYSSPV